jgi:SAM-dependent methyltransferase
MPAKNPWLSIPAADYEGHMAAVAQAAPLHAAFAEVYRALRPARLAVLGCGPGGGLDAVDPAVTQELVCVDLNPAYLELARQRHPRLAGITRWLCASVGDCQLEAGSLDLVHAALLFEHVDPAPVLPRIARWLAPAGVLSVVLQLPGDDAAISPSPFHSLGQLSGLMRLVPPDELKALALRESLQLSSATEVPLPRGKAFWVARFARPGRA